MPQTHNLFSWMVPQVEGLRPPDPSVVGVRCVHGLRPDREEGGLPRVARWTAGARWKEEKWSELNLLMRTLLQKLIG